jgi:hypothetical protein
MTNPLQLLNLFHALMGLCVGWFWGSRFGVPIGIAAAVGGAALGLVAGILISEMPGRIRSARARISNNRPLAIVLATSAHLIWLAVGISFWWICLSFFAGELTP